ncbi:MAG: DUF3465 domain-containing protein [Kiritimatiellae bacterium]|jgi:hypothetical protein|nr:DUF3465 domain-containing protein [Kiritimatiellia bacterium]
MKRIITIIVLICIVYFGGKYFGIDWLRLTQRENNNNLTSKTYNIPSSGSQLSGSGKVIRILSDDNTGSRHQRFILELPNNQTILIAHNIDIAPRVPSLRVGDVISFNGVYESNSEGGVVHWTHRDPDGHHTAGWLQKNGQTYQ